MLVCRTCGQVIVCDLLWSARLCEQENQKKRSGGDTPMFSNKSAFGPPEPTPEEIAKKKRAKLRIRVRCRSQCRAYHVSGETCAACVLPVDSESRMWKRQQSRTCEDRVGGTGDDPSVCGVCAGLSDCESRGEEAKGGCGSNLR